ATRTINLNLNLHISWCDAGRIDIRRNNSGDCLMLPWTQCAVVDRFTAAPLYIHLTLLTHLRVFVLQSRRIVRDNQTLARDAQAPPSTMDLERYLTLCGDVEYLAVILVAVLGPHNVVLGECCWHDDFSFSNAAGFRFLAAGRRLNS